MLGLGLVVESSSCETSICSIKDMSNRHISKKRRRMVEVREAGKEILKSDISKRIKRTESKADEAEESE